MFLFEGREVPLPILADRFDERELRGAGAPAQLHAVLVLAPFRHVGHQVDAERAVRRDDARDRSERRGQIARPDQRLQDAIGRQDLRKRPRLERQSADVTADEIQRCEDLRM